MMNFRNQHSKAFSSLQSLSICFLSILIKLSSALDQYSQYSAPPYHPFFIRAFNLLDRTASATSFPDSFELYQTDGISFYRYFQECILSVDIKKERNMNISIEAIAGLSEENVSFSFDSFTPEKALFFSPRDAAVELNLSKNDSSLPGVVSQFPPCSALDLGSSRSSEEMKVFARKTGAFPDYDNLVVVKRAHQPGQQMNFDIAHVQIKGRLPSETEITVSRETLFVSLDVPGVSLISENQFEMVYRDELSRIVGMVELEDIQKDRALSDFDWDLDRLKDSIKFEQRTTLAKEWIISIVVGFFVFVILIGCLCSRMPGEMGYSGGIIGGLSPLIGSNEDDELKKGSYFGNQDLERSGRLVSGQRSQASGSSLREGLFMH